MILNLNSLKPNPETRRRSFKAARNKLLSSAAAVQSNQVPRSSNRRQLPERRRRNLAIALERRKGMDRRNQLVPTNVCPFNKIDSLA